MTCVVCDEALDPDEESDSAWYPEPWCFGCMRDEDRRGARDETIPGSSIRYTLPRYYATKSEWGPGAASDARFEELVSQLIGDDDGSED